MPTTATELAKARDTLAGLLALLDLGGYRFELSPEGDAWTVALECAAPDGWIMVRLRLTRAELGAAAADVAARGRLLDALDTRLRGCRRET